MMRVVAISARAIKLRQDSVLQQNFINFIISIHLALTERFFIEPISYSSPIDVEFSRCTSPV